MHSCQHFHSCSFSAPSHIAKHTTGSTDLTLTSLAVLQEAWERWEQMESQPWSACEPGLSRVQAREDLLCAVQSLQASVRDGMPRMRQYVEKRFDQVDVQGSWSAIGCNLGNGLLPVLTPDLSVLILSLLSCASS